MTTRDAGPPGPSVREGTVSVLSSREFPEVVELLGRNPVENLFILSRLHAAHMDSWRLGAQLWGYRVGGRLEAVCYAGANVVPSRAGEEAVVAFAEKARLWGARCSSLVGPADTVAPLWHLLEPLWGPARELRPDQPVMVLDRPPAIPPDPQVRLVRPDEIDILMPAAVAMFTEEVGVSPIGADGGGLYRARVAELIASGQAFARIEDGKVVFKAEIGALTPDAGQVQGVWVAPERRGQRLSEGGMAAVAQHTLDMIAPMVTLYVNSYNIPARAAYRRVGFAEVGRCMTVLL